MLPTSSRLRWRSLSVASLLVAFGMVGCTAPPPCPQLPVTPAVAPDLQTEDGPARWMYTDGGVLLRYESDDPYGNFINRLWSVDPATLDETPLIDRSGVTAEVSGSVTPDGRFIAVRSATSLDGSPDPYPQFTDAWLLDTLTGDATRITAANGSVDHVTISDDGTRVAFDSWATDITSETDLNPENLSGGEPSWQDVFVWDRTTATVTRLSNEPNTASFGSRIAADGQTVAFRRIGARFLVDVSTGAVGQVPEVSGVDQFGHDVDVALALRPDSAVAIDTDRALAPADTNGTADLYVIDPVTLLWRNATAASGLSTYPVRYWDLGPIRFPGFLVAPVYDVSTDGTTTVAIEGAARYGYLVRRSPEGAQVLTEGFEWNHLSRVAISPDGQTVVATLARFQDDRYCGVRPWRTLVFTFSD